MPGRATARSVTATTLLFIFNATCYGLAEDAPRDNRSNVISNFRDSNLSSPSAASAPMPSPTPPTRPGARHRNRSGANAATLRRQTIQLCTPGTSFHEQRTPFWPSQSTNCWFERNNPSSLPHEIQSRRRRSLAVKSSLGKLAAKSLKPPELNAQSTQIDRDCSGPRSVTRPRPSTNP